VTQAVACPRLQRLPWPAQVLQAAVCPERRYGVDDELSAIATVTEVELSKDLAVAKIYISIYSDPTGQDAAWDGLRRLQGCAYCAVARPCMRSGWL
jgi:ribosome-binding factor A